MAKLANESEASNGGLREKLDNKTEAVRRALEELGRSAKPLEIKDHVKKYYGVTISTKVISVYKGKLKAGRRKGKRGRRAKAEEAAVPAAAPPARGRDAAIDIRVLRALKDLSQQIGAARLRDLIELLV